MDVSTRRFTVEEAHAKGWCHDMSLCSTCIQSRAELIARLEAEGKFELLWKHYR